MCSCKAQIIRHVAFNKCNSFLYLALFSEPSGELVVTPVLPSIKEIILDLVFILGWKHLSMMSDVGSSICNKISKALTNPVASQGSLTGTDRTGLCLSPLLHTHSGFLGEQLMLHWVLLTTDSSPLESFLGFRSSVWASVSQIGSVFIVEHLLIWSSYSSRCTSPSFAFMHTYLPTCSLPHATWPILCGRNCRSGGLIFTAPNTDLSLQCLLDTSYSEKPTLETHAKTSLILSKEILH